MTAEISGYILISISSFVLTMISGYACWSLVRNSMFARDMASLRDCLSSNMERRGWESVPFLVVLREGLDSLVNNADGVTVFMFFNAVANTPTSEPVGFESLTDAQRLMATKIIDAAFRRMVHFVFREQLMGAIVSGVATLASSKSVVRDLTRRFKMALVWLFHESSRPATC